MVNHVLNGQLTLKMCSWNPQPDYQQA